VSGWIRRLGELGRHRWVVVAVGGDGYSLSISLLPLTALAMQPIYTMVVFVFCVPWVVRRVVVSRGRWVNGSPTIKIMYRQNSPTFPSYLSVNRL
jgi:hypothetical protein